MSKLCDLNVQAPVRDSCSDQRVTPDLATLTCTDMHVNDGRLRWGNRTKKTATSHTRVVFQITWNTCTLTGSQAGRRLRPQADTIVCITNHHRHRRRSGLRRNLREHC
eukprot:1114044-Prorocentrum_minimum.AAC.4